MNEPLEVSCARCGRPTPAVRSKTVENNEMDCCPHCDRIVGLEIANEQFDTEVRRLRGEVARQAEQITAVRALTGGPFADGYQPYAVELEDGVHFAVLLDDLRAALDGAA